ncbi:MAG: hypothetical protein ACRDGA_12590 [Bacteroidota bacterium]
MSTFLKNSVPLLAVLLVSSSFMGGCKRGDNPLDELTAITETNLFPFAVGRLFVFTAYTLDTTGKKIQSSTHREALYVRSAITIGGKNGFTLIDSVYFTDGTLSYVDSTYFASDDGDLLVYYGTWVTLFKRSAGVDNEYDAGSFSETLFGVPIVLNVKCKIRPKESVTVPIGTVQAYKLEVKTSTTLGGQTYEFLQYAWFADGFGPVKQQEPVQVDPVFGIRLNGSESLLVSKNF